MLLAINSNSDFSKVSKPVMRLYVIRNLFSKKFFDSMEELEEYMDGLSEKTKEGVLISTVEYYKHLAGRDDVIVSKQDGQKPILVTVLDEISYAVFNPYDSSTKKDFIWEYYDGTLEEVCSAFRNSGIKFKNDVYAEIDQDVEDMKQWYEDYMAKAKFKVYSNIDGIRNKSIE